VSLSAVALRYRGEVFLGSASVDVDADRRVVCDHLRAHALGDGVPALRSSDGRYAGHHDGIGALSPRRTHMHSTIASYTLVRPREILGSSPREILGSSQFGRPAVQEVRVRPPPDFENELEEEQCREDLGELREQLRDVRTLLLENKKSTMDKLERRRRAAASGA
jgi:hypothetical protein